jgi:hypothetical protein
MTTTTNPPADSSSSLAKTDPLKLDLPSPLAMAALRRGDRVGLLQQTFTDPIPANMQAGIDKLANLALEQRRQSISVLGNHEAFVRHGANGSLQQVIRPVVLSMADKTLYQMTRRLPYKKGTDERFWGEILPGEKNVEWRDVPVGSPSSAEVTMPGYNRINGVAGCAVGGPPTVVVDGETRSNPFIERSVRKNGLGDILRVVIGAIVVGPAPATGNPVVLTYTLDYDPAKDLQHMIGNIADRFPDECYLSTEDEAAEENLANWTFLPMFGGVGYYYNLRCAAVLEAYRDFTNILQNATKKAQTVARRNAMRSHPALAFQSVEMDDQRRAILPVVGWAGDDRATVQWMKLSEALARGQEIPALAEVERISVEGENYDPARHVAEADAEERPPVASANAPTVIDHEAESRDEKNRLIDQIDSVLGVGTLTPTEVHGLGYAPNRQNVEELRGILSRANAMIAAHRPPS